MFFFVFVFVFVFSFFSSLAVYGGKEFRDAPL